MQGFNMGRYVPPDQEGLITGNQRHGKHPLGARAAADGSLTVRFEMPFAIWCAGCPRPTLIAQGVRFNAAKRRVGAYHSTPIFSFRMRHPACGADIEIRTDPQNTAYAVVSGARRREEPSPAAASDSLVGDSGFSITTDKEHHDRREQAFAHLEKTIEDRTALAAAKERIGELRDAAGRHWADPYARNRRLRRTFREGRHAREAAGATDDALRDRMSLAIDLLPARAEDAERARLVDFGAGEPAPDVDRALATPLFDETKATTPKTRRESEGGKKKLAREGRKLKSEIVAERMRESLALEAVGNSRAARDPFLSPGQKDATARTPARIPGIKRKRPADDDPGGTPGEEKTTSTAPALVNYDSD